MNINKKIVANKIIFLLDGKLDKNSVTELKKYFDQSINEKQIDIILDFTRVSYINGSAIEFFIQSANKLKQIGGSFVFLRLDENIIKILKDLNLYSVFNIVDDLNKAISVKSAFKIKDSTMI